VEAGSQPYWTGCCRPDRHFSFRHVCCGMAFPIPSHLPKKQPTDVSSAILARISDASSKSLNATLTESWITDLDESIRAAKVSPCLCLRPPSPLITQLVPSNSSMSEYKETFHLSTPSSLPQSQFALAFTLSGGTQTTCPMQFPIPRCVHPACSEDVGVEGRAIFSQVSLRISSEH